MSIYNISPGRWLVRVRTRQGGKVFCRKKKMTGTRQDAWKVEYQLRDELAEGKKVCSFKIRFFGDALKYYRENASIVMSHVGTLYDKLDRDLGTVPLNQLTERFTAYWTHLRSERSLLTGRVYSNATRNHLLGYAKTALNFCKVRGLIEKNPLDCFSKLPAPGRDRVLTEDETGGLLNVLKRRDSYLYWPVRFSLKNPIRRGDLCRLRRENVNWFEPWIHFYPSKTKDVKPRETCLPFLEDDLLSYLKTVPEGGLLFPRIDVNGNSKPLGDFKNHWHAVLREAGITGFTWHDLKHCAITWMLDNGYSERDLKNLGIQYSRSLIDRYYHHDAAKVVVKWKAQKAAVIVAPGCGTFAEKTVNFA